MAKKETGEAVSKIAARVLAAGNPFVTDKKIRSYMAASIHGDVMKMTPEGRTPAETEEVIAQAVARVFEETLLPDIKALAASALSQDETKAKKK